MRTHVTIFCPLLLLHVLLSGVLGLPDGLHPTPPMGWTSWNTFFEENSQERMITQVTQHTCHIMSCHVSRQIDALLELGLDKYGYKFMTIDDWWQLADRDAETGRMVANPGR